MALPTQQSSLAMRANSRVIMKSRPKVRIVHIFAPEIIKTDIANFRDIVQQLTGKPSKGMDGDGKTKKRKNRKKNAEVPAMINGKVRFGKLTNVRHDGGGGVGKSLPEEEEIGTWMEESSGRSTGCQRELEEIDGFIKELSDLL